MARKKQQKKRLKKYKGKYVTADRLDMSKGGRVKAQVGGMQKAPISRRRPPMSIEREEEVRPNVQPSIPVQPKPVLSPPPKDSNGKVTAKKEEELANLNVSNNQIIPNVSTGNPQTGATPEEIAALKGVGNEIKKRQVPKRPNFIGEKGSDQTFIGREGEVRPAMSVRDVDDYEDRGRGRGRDERDEPRDPPNGQATRVIRGIIYSWDGFKYVNTGEKASDNTDTTTTTDTSETPATPQMDLDTTAAQQRTERIAQTAEQVQARAEGEVPEAAIIPGISEEAGTLLTTEIPQEVTTMAEPTRVTTEGAAQVAPEAVTTGQVTTAPTPEGFEAAEITRDELDIVPLDAQVKAAEGEVSDQAIAQAAGVERVAPIEGAEVEIPEGALAERVVGKISEGAKATAAINAGTSLSRITRAKKQLSRAGLSDADIQEIGNDPEALEDRLADFSEEQRGIIEGLPEEALVSTQINGLLEGMENGEIPVWARPAVAQVEQMLAQRGMSASTVGRDSLFNAIIQSAMPIAQSNAQAIQSSVAQQRDIEARESEANAARVQQTALTNAQNVFQMDMAQFSSDQQIALSNSKFMQTVGLTKANNEQQAAIQDALLMSQANLAEADFYQKAQIQNAQAFLSMDMANLNNKQQANVLKAQQTQQRLLSNQSAQNAAAQFNAASENQTNQFMSNLNAQMNQYNASQMNAMEQFNANQANAAEARRANREADIEKFNTQLLAQVDQFNSQQDFARNQWNAQNTAAVEASNVQWRRQANTINTAAQNQINMQNAQNAFGLSSQAMSFLWQELRDQADFDFRAAENTKAQITQLQATAIANEGALAEKSTSTTKDLMNLVNSVIQNYYST